MAPLHLRFVMTAAYASAGKSSSTVRPMNAYLPVVRADARAPHPPLKQRQP